jgi:hypothetical protein
MGHLSDVERGVKEGSSAFIQGVAKGLGVNAYDLVIEAGYRMATGEVESVFERGDIWEKQYQDLVSK